MGWVSARVRGDLVAPRRAVSVRRHATSRTMGGRPLLGLDSARLRRWQHPRRDDHAGARGRRGVRPARAAALQPGRDGAEPPALLGDRRRRGRARRSRRAAHAALLSDPRRVGGRRPLHARVRARVPGAGGDRERARAGRRAPSPRARGAAHRRAHAGGDEPRRAPRGAPHVRRAHAARRGAHRSPLRAPDRDGRHGVARGGRRSEPEPLPPQLGPGLRGLGDGVEPGVLGHRGRAPSAGRRLPGGDAGERRLLPDHRAAPRRVGAADALHRRARARGSARRGPLHRGLPTRCGPSPRSCARRRTR